MDKGSPSFELIKRFPKESYEKALQSWRWLVPEDAIPLLASSFGDIFFAFRGMIFYLDLINGNFDLIAESMDELDKILTRQTLCASDPCRKLVVLLITQGIGKPSGLSPHHKIT